MRKVIISVNAGSSSLKFKMFEMPNENVLVEGIFERIGQEVSNYEIKTSEKEVAIETKLETHKEAIDTLLKELLEIGVINDLSEISGVGHRVVHGGEKYNKATLITEKVIEDIQELAELAPLHNPANLIGIKAFGSVLEGVPQVAIFDTAFHQTMDKEAYIYPTPYEWYENYGIRKYGFHGSSHKYVSIRTAELLGKDVKDTKVVTAHVGNGVSLCAVKHGESIDTTMGFTPLAGVSMGTRSGDIDPAIIEYISNKEHKTAVGVLVQLNKKSGYLGVSGRSSDVRDIDKCIKEGDERCKLALDIQTKDIADFISSYIAYMDGADAICFTAGVGENYAKLRKDVCDRLTYHGVELDEESNELPKSERLISTKDSKIKVFIVPTNEELMIAKETYECI